ncbi:AAA family ATPase [Candidatus Woesearchaeota archaeon]|nr:AAA family ATPase [Candidatus Woesearchaeota archaeon]
MGTIINLHGPPGVGKSTLSTILREKLPDYAYVDRPYIKRGLKPAGKELAKRLSKQAAYFLIGELIKEEKDVITEEINPKSLYNRFGQDYFKEHGYEVHSFRLTCPVEVAIRRDLERSAKTIGEEQMRAYHEEYGEAQPYETVIDTSKHGIDECIGIIMQKIKN